MSLLDSTKARGISLALKQCIKELQRDTAKSRANQAAVSAVLPTLQALQGFSDQKADLLPEELQLLLDSQIPARLAKLATSLLHLALVPAKHQGPNQLVAQPATGLLSKQAFKALRLAVEVLDALHLKPAVQGPQGVAWSQQVVTFTEDGIPGENGLCHLQCRRTSCTTAVASSPLIQQACW